MDRFSKDLDRENESMLLLMYFAKLLTVQIDENQNIQVINKKMITAY